MTPLPAQRTRVDRAFERLYRQNVREVYRYALVVLRSPEDAEDVAQTTFLNAYRVFLQGERFDSPRNRLIGIAHELCHQRAQQQARRNEVDLEEQVAEAVPDEEGPSRNDIQRASSLEDQDFDGMLRRSERRALRAHVRVCEDCAAFARGQRSQRTALRALADVPLPRSLSSFFVESEAPRASVGRT